ncbi:hypothetical protein IWW56_005281 [Coemansia sp. RSA 2131]|nr:hypothetical protein IWW56_005281 [Coemansia sp. RSA 2131]
MSELVQGVKLKFELPFKLPTPVSFPFELIGDFRPITRIPKYDYSLEKKIMKEIAKQKQQDQFNMLKQAQQQLSMVDLIASRKNRHKGKEPDRNTMAAASSSGNGQLLKPSSESGVSRLENSAPAETAALRPEQSLARQQSSNLDTSATTLAVSAATPADELAAVPIVRVERPHSAGPGVPAAHSAAGPSPDVVYSQAQMSFGTSPAASIQPLHHLGPVQYPPGPQPPSPAKPPGLYQPPTLTQVPAQRPPNGTMGFAVRPIPNHQQHTSAAPAFALGGGPSTNIGFHSMVDLPVNRPRPQPQLQPRPQGIPMQQQQPALRPPTSGFNRFSTSFGSGPNVASSHTNQITAPSQPALPPKPDEWKLQSTSTSEPLQPRPSSSTDAPPIPPRRNWNQSQQEPRPPALPPKPSAFTEFDYAVDGPSDLVSSEPADHVEQLGTLLSMGFSRPQAIHALEMYDYDVNKASNYLIDKAV